MILNSKKVKHILSLLIIIRLQKTVVGPCCYQFRKQEKMKEKYLTRAVIHKYFKNLIKENQMEMVVILTTNDKTSKKIFLYLEDSFEKPRDWSIAYYPSYQQSDYKENIDKFLNKPHGILVTNYECFQGVQARNVVLFIGDKTDKHTARSMILRSMAFAIVIHDLEENNFDIPGIVQDMDLYKWRNGELGTKKNLHERMKTVPKKEKVLSNKIAKLQTKLYYQEHIK